MNPKSISRYFLYCIVIAGVYYGSSIITIPIILPPTYAAPIWPAAGIGVGVIVLWGYRYIPAIILGEILINYKFYDLSNFINQPSILLIYLPMLLAAVFRSAVGAYLVNRFIGKTSLFLSASSVLKLFLFAGLIPTLISSLFSTYILTINRIVQADDFILNFMTWWYGDSVGVFIVLPLMFLLFRKPRNIWRHRVYKTTLPVIVSFILLVFAAYYIKQFENKAIQSDLRNKLEYFTSSVLDGLQHDNHDTHTTDSSTIVEKINHLFLANSGEINKNKQLDDLMFNVSSITGASTLNLYQSGNTEKSSIKTVSKVLQFANHEWLITASTSSKYFKNNSTWLIWWLLSIGFLFVAFLGAGLLVMTGSYIVVSKRVAKRTKEVEELNVNLIESNRRYKQLVEIQPVVIWRHTRGKKTLDFVSDEAINILGYSKSELLDLNYILNNILHTNDLERTIVEYTQGVKSGKRFTLKYRALKKDGTVVWFKDYISTRKNKGKSEVIGLKIDITIEQQRENKITQLALFDAMTKLPNRVSFMDSLEDAIKQSIANQSSGAVLYLDLDRFKVFNDSMGHKLGDKLIVQVSRRLRSVMDRNDVLSRFSGDEFVILTCNLGASIEESTNKVEKLVAEIMNSIEKSFMISGYSFYISVSIGISMFPFHSDSPEQVVQQADMSMYVAKNQGRHGHEFYQVGMQQQANKKLQIENSINDGLLNQEFEMHYQPTVNKIGAIIGCEALIRWNHPEQGFLKPSLFISIAEELGLIISLGNWIIDDVFKSIHRWNLNNYKTIQVAINISLLQFHSDQFVDTLENKINEYNINPSQVLLEITESIGIDNIYETLTVLNQIKALGFQIAIDDFGTGFSSLNHLTQMPIDILKIDKSFIKDIEVQSKSRDLIEVIIAMANKLNLSVTVEGIESEGQFNVVKEIGCDSYQGFYFSKVITEKKLVETYLI